MRARWNHGESRPNNIGTGRSLIMPTVNGLSPLQCPRWTFTMGTSQTSLCMHMTSSLPQGQHSSGNAVLSEAITSTPSSRRIVDAVVGAGVWCPGQIASQIPSGSVGMDTSLSVATVSSWLGPAGEPAGLRIPGCHPPFSLAHLKSGDGCRESVDELAGTLSSCHPHHALVLSRNASARGRP